MSTQEDRIYYLPRDASESARLIHQHGLYTRIVGFLLHPEILQRAHAASSTPDAPPLRIADVGIGTGIWLQDLSSHLPRSTILIGLDLSDAQLPPLQSRIPNYSFRTLNILDPVPEDLKNTFDIVHARCLVGGLPTGAWDTAAKNMLALLKPDGWLQWQEPIMQETTTCRTDASASIARLEKLLTTVLDIWQKIGRGGPETANLASLIQEAGFVDVKAERFISDQRPELREALTAVNKAAGIGALAMVAKNDPEFGWTMDDVEELSRECEEDMRGGKVYWSLRLNVVIAQKPQEA